MSRGNRKSRTIISIIITVIIYCALNVITVMINRLGINFIMGTVSVSGIIVGIQILLAIYMTLKHYKIGGLIGMVLLLFTMVNAIMAIISTGNPAPLPGVLELIVGFFAVTMIRFNKSRAEHLYNKDSLAIKSISDIFMAMYFLDLKSDTYEEYNAVCDIEDAVGIKGKGIQDALERAIVTRVDDDMEEETRQFLDLSSVTERLQGSKMISMDVKSQIYGWCRLGIIPVKYDDNQKLERLLFSMQIVDKEKQKELEFQNQLLYRSRHDELTDLYNRKYFMERVAELLEQNSDVEYCMVCMDIKSFRLVNEVLGKEKADQVLLTIADLLRKYRVEDMVFARLSADRFAFCIRENLLTREYVQEICNCVAGMQKDKGLRMHLQVGIYKILDYSEEPSVMCDRAMEAINEIKEDYQENVSYYDNMMRKKLLDENVLVGEIENALIHHQFVMYLQPQISNEGILLGGEALVRWIHPERGLVPPIEFIPVSEKSGQIVKLDMQIWEMACRKLKEWKKAGLTDLHISVNISPKDFYYVNLYDVFTGLVEEYEISPQNLKLEITETTMMTEVKRQTDVLKKLRQYGFQIEIDDFGSGYSSLNTLENIEVDVLKLDMGFLRQSQHNERSKMILKFIITLAKSLGLVTVTEGVETQEQVMELTQVGCDVFQGYYFSKPVPVEEFEKKYSLNV